MVDNSKTNQFVGRVTSTTYLAAGALCLYSIFNPELAVQLTSRLKSSATKAYNATIKELRYIQNEPSYLKSDKEIVYLGRQGNISVRNK